MTTHPDLPELTDAQIDRMYVRVTGQIDRDARDRRTKRRRSLLAAASVVAVLGIGGAVVGGGASLLSPSSDQAGDSSAPSMQSGGGAADDKAVPENGMVDGIDGPRDFVNGAKGGAAPETDREIVTTASATLIVDVPGTAADDLSAWTVKQGGRVEMREESTHDDRTTITMRVRVPADAAGDTTAYLRDLGTVSGLSIQSDDVTAVGRDLDARIHALQLSVGRLEQLMTKAATTSDLLAAEKTLSQRQGELESLQAERRGLSDQVAMATYNVEIVTEPEPEAPSPSGFLGGLEAGWDGLVATLGFAVRVVGFVLPWAALLAVLAAAYLAVRRLRHS